MKAEDWNMIGYLGIALSLLFFTVGGWIWLNVEGYMGWGGWLKYFEYRTYPMPLFIIGVIFLIIGSAFVWRATEERKFETEKSASYSLMKCPKCGTKYPKTYIYCPKCKAQLEPVKQGERT